MLLFKNFKKISGKNLSNMSSRNQKKTYILGYWSLNSNNSTILFETGRMIITFTGSCLIFWEKKLSLKEY